MNKQDASFRTTEFATAGVLPGAFAKVAPLLSAVGDLSFILSNEGIILDLAVSQSELHGHPFRDWIGIAWIDTVTIESRPKIIEMLAGVGSQGDQPRWRQVNHLVPGGELPVRYLLMPVGDSDRLIAVGREMRTAAAMQQRLLQTQQSLERDYIRLRQAETRYRLMFDMASEAVLIVDAETRHVREANPAAHRLLDMADGTLIGRPIRNLFEEAEREKLVAHLGAAEASDDLSPIVLPLVGRRGGVSVSARLFRQARTPQLIVRLTPAGEVAAGHQYDAALSDVVERMPDGFVLVDKDFKILAANSAFVELAEMSSEDRVIGVGLGTWLGRSGIDLDLIMGQLKDHGAVRNVASIFRGSAGAREEIEVSAVAAPLGASTCYGFTIRNVSRRLREATSVTRDVPRSVEQLTELVGRMSLKEIVRESTDLVERLCIEAALEYTSDNRASAAEILGVSRQSLYSKLHRHGLGNLVSDDN